MKERPFFTSFHKFYTKDKDITNHWVGHSKMKPIDDDKLFNRKVIIDELESDLNDYDKTEASSVTEVVQEGAFLNTSLSTVISH